MQSMLRNHGTSDDRTWTSARAVALRVFRERPGLRALFNYARALYRTRGEEGEVKKKTISLGGSGVRTRMIRSPSQRPTND